MNKHYAEGQMQSRGNVSDLSARGEVNRVYLSAGSLADYLLKHRDISAQHDVVFCGIVRGDKMFKLKSSGAEENLAEKADELGANTVLDVRYQTIGKEIFAYGSAYRVIRSVGRR